MTKQICPFCHPSLLRVNPQLANSDLYFLSPLLLLLSLFYSTKLPSFTIKIFSEILQKQKNKNHFTSLTFSTLPHLPSTFIFIPTNLKFKSFSTPQLQKFKNSFIFCYAFQSWNLKLSFSVRVLNTHLSKLHKAKIFNFHSFNFCCKSLCIWLHITKVSKFH